MKYAVYVLISVSYPYKYYVGITTNLHKRLQEHNSENLGYTKRYSPWKVETYTVFNDRLMAQAFEKYLKSGSGQAFLKKHLLPIK